MKKATSIAVLLLAVFCFSAEAKILRVAFSGPKVSGVDFDNVNSAITAATAGDTIHLYQNASVGASEVKKRLVFLGFGYKLETNSGLQAVPSAQNQVGLYFNEGSENSVVQGVYGDFRVAVDDITISRCSGTVYLGSNQYGQSVPISSASIVSSLIQIYGYQGVVNNGLISNSIITYFEGSNIGGLIINNIVFSAGNFGSSVVQNNIFTQNCPSGNNAIFEKNIFRASTCTIAGSNNLFNIDMNNVFVNWNNGDFGSENNLVLKTGSPAIGFGTDGSGNTTDAGIYGGEAGYVYKPSGIPAIPSIYKLTAPQLNATTNPYTITISVRSNN